jgi:hypothetical protein
VIFIKDKWEKFAIGVLKQGIVGLKIGGLKIGGLKIGGLGCSQYMSPFMDLWTTPAKD